MRNQLNIGAHWVIEGRAFATVKAVYRYARGEKGYTGTERCLAERIKRGAHTWAELVAKPKISGNSKPASDRKKAEMHAICARIDSRRVVVSKDEEE